MLQELVDRGDLARERGEQDGEMKGPLRRVDSDHEPWKDDEEADEVSISSLEALVGCHPFLIISVHLFLSDATLSSVALTRLSPSLCATAGAPR